MFPDHYLNTLVETRRNPSIIVNNVESRLPSYSLGFYHIVWKSVIIKEIDYRCHPIRCVQIYLWDIIMVPTQSIQGFLDKCMILPHLSCTCKFEENICSVILVCG